MAALELFLDEPVAVSEAPDAFLVTFAPLGMGVLDPDGVRFLKIIKHYYDTGIHLTQTSTTLTHNTGQQKNKTYLFPL